jgi:hypothetical protein
VQAFASLQFAFTGVPTQVPLEHASGVVQDLPSLQGFVLSFVNTHPVAGFELGDAGLHVSSVHAFVSSQFAFTGVETQAPALQASVVQLLLSVHTFVLSFVKRQPDAGSELGDAGLHVSSVHAFVSLQFAFTGVETQLPALHASVVQPLLSVHVFVLSFVKRQPDAGFELGDAGLHASSVHAFASLQSAFTGVDTQLPALHASVVQLLLSVQAFVLSFVNRQPDVGSELGDAGLHVSSVHTSPSSQFAFTGVPMQDPALHASDVHVFPSEQEFVLSFVKTQPAAL